MVVVDTQFSYMDEYLQGLDNQSIELITRRVSLSSRLIGGNGSRLVILDHMKENNNQICSQLTY